MNKLLLTVLVFSISLSAIAQKDASLQTRLKNFMEANSYKNFEKIMDYTYPKLFTLVPRGQMVTMIKKTFDNDEMKLGMDSLKIDSLYPVFKMQNGSYAKIVYSMRMSIKLKNETKSEDEQKQMNASLLSVMQSKYGQNNTRSDSTGSVLINLTSVMVAVKDAYAKEWCFANLTEADPLISKLFSKELLNKLATYK